jgi:hypothetical protein
LFFGVFIHSLIKWCAANFELGLHAPQWSRIRAAREIFAALNSSSSEWRVAARLVKIDVLSALPNVLNAHAVVYWSFMHKKLKLRKK